MAEGEPEQDAGQRAGKDQPSLELPSLGWRRRRRTPKPAPQAAVEETEPLPEATLPEATLPEATLPEAPTPESPRPMAVAEPAPERVPEPEPQPRRERRERGPGGMPAVLVTGVVVGLGIVGLTWASLRLCESVQGTSSCGDTGYGLLIAILALMIVVGMLLLRLARVPEPGSTSFLAVGLTCVLALLFLVDSLLDRPMVVVIPLISVGAFPAAHWVTRTFTGPSAS